MVNLFGRSHFVCRRELSIKSSDMDVITKSSFENGLTETEASEVSRDSLVL